MSRRSMRTHMEWKVAIKGLRGCVAEQLVDARGHFSAALLVK